MNAFLKGFMRIFSWMDCFDNLSPKERVDQILDDFYFDHPWIERNDQKALENDSRALENDFNNVWNNKNY
jgi:hypothetical protein